MSNYQAIERLLEVRHYKQAEEQLSRQLAENPGAAEGYYYLARLAYARHDFAQAKGHARECLSRDPASRDAQHLLVEIHWRLDEDVECEALLLDILRAEPNDAGPMARYALLLLRNLFVDEARALASAALQQDPEHEGACIASLQLALVDGDTQAVTAGVSRLLTEHSQSLFVTATVFDALIAQRRFFAAEHVGREMVRMRPDNEALVYHLIALRAKTHPVAWLAYPHHRFGWFFSAALCLGWLALLPALPRPAADGLSICCVSWAIYMCVHPLPLRLWIEWQGM